MKGIIKILCVATLACTFSSCANMYMTKGQEDLSNLKYTDAIESLSRSVEKKASVEGSTLLAQAYMETGQPVAAVYEYEKIKSDVSFNDALKLEYASALLSANRPDEALEIANGILSRNAGDQKAQSIKISVNRRDKMKQDSSLYAIEPYAINGLDHAMSPVLTKDGLVVSGEKSGIRTKDDYTGYSYLDLYQVTDSGSVKKLDISDSKFHDGMAAYNADETYMIFNRTNQAETNKIAFSTQNISNPQLYSSRKENGTWSKPEKLAFNDENYIFGHPALSDDGNTLFFASNKPGGIGKMDIYKSVRNGGAWSTPVALGPNINTTGDDAFPVLKDENTLYFSSDSHQTLGGLDILYSLKEGDTWSTPVQLSAPLNSPLDDFGAVYYEDNKGYLTSNRGGKDRIFKFEQFYPELKIDGTIAESGESIPGMQLTIKNLTDNTSEVILADENGKFSYDLLPNKKYEILVEDLNEDQIYFNSTKKISTMGLREDEVFDLDFNLERIKIVSDTDNIKPGEDGTYPIPNIHWDYNDWKVRTDAEPYLQMLTDLLKANPALKVEIRSHCDSRGSHGFNRDLSKKRAKAVMNHLITKGIERNRLSSKGLGEKELLNKCSDGVECTEAEHQENRRSEFIVTDKSGNKKRLD